MTHPETADLLNRAALKLSLAYSAEVEKERDSRWDGDDAQADLFRDEAEEILILLEQCRAAASRLATHTIVRRNRIPERAIDRHPAAPH